MKLSVCARGEEMIYPRVLNDEIKFHARIEFLSISITIISSFGFSDGYCVMFLQLLVSLLLLHVNLNSVSSSERKLHLMNNDVE